jgi:peptide/nickel transport system permease protein
MLKYILKRLLIFIPTLFIISLMAFIISSSAPGDPVEKLANAPDSEGANNVNNTSNQAEKQKIRKRLGLDKPVFYFSMGTLAECDTLYKIQDVDHQKVLSKLTHRHGNWPAISSYYLSLMDLRQAHSVYTENYKDSVRALTGKMSDPTWITVDSTFLVEQVVGDSVVMTDSLVAGFKYQKDTTMVYDYSSNDMTNALNQSIINLSELTESYKKGKINAKLAQLKTIYASYEFFAPVRSEFEKVNKKYKYLLANEQKWKTYIPSLNLYGTNNRYHVWIKNLLVNGDFGNSFITQKPISENIWEKFWRSFTLIFISVFIAYMVSIPIGVYSAYKKGSVFDRSSSLILFILYSLPNFFIGTLLLYAFANPDTLNWFPEAGHQSVENFDESWGWFDKFWHRFPYMTLPLITYTYSSFAFLSRIMRVGMIEVIGQDYIRTARAKGLSESKVIWKHAFRNSLLPIITVFANIFPLAIGGSVIVEHIFSYHGMGMETLLAIKNEDYPIIIAIFTLAGFLTMVGYLVADIMYAIVDPRISYSKK